MSRLRVLVAGVGRAEIYEPAFATALEQLGVDVHRFEWDRYLRGHVGRFQEKWALPGFALPRLNRALLAEATGCNADVVLVWRGTMIWPATVRAIRERTGALLVSYNNDDPFSWRHLPVAPYHAKMWRHYVRAIPEYDLHFVYRALNVSELEAEGAPETHVLMPYFVPSLHHPMTLTDDERGRFACDAVFVGHFEDDGRASCVRALVDAGVRVRVFGAPAWTEHLRGLPGFDRPVRPLDGLDYARALAGAKVGLCFLSRLNRDTYTRRCFEIPACRTVLVSERSADLERLFAEDVEAVLFSSAQQLVDKVQRLLADEPRRRAIAEAGYRRVLRDGHSVNDRAREWLATVEAARSRRAERVPRV